MVWDQFLVSQYGLTHEAFLALSDDVRDSLFFTFIWTNSIQVSECEESAHRFFEHYNPITTELYRCCHVCTMTQSYDRGWASFSFARFFELLEHVCWAALEYRFWSNEDKRCMQQVSKILEIS